MYIVRRATARAIACHLTTTILYTNNDATTNNDNPLGR